MLKMFDLGEKIIDFFKDYSFLLSDTKQKAKYGEELKIITPKQMLQRLPIALAQVKAGNTSENLLNQMRQICIKQKKQYNEFNKVKKQWIIYLWILEILNMLLYQILAFTIQYKKVIWK